MKLMSNGKEVGTIYCSVQLAKDAFSMSYIEVLDKLKEGSLTLDLDKGKYKVSSYRRVYQDDNNIYLEGAELQSK